MSLAVIALSGNLMATTTTSFQFFPAAGSATNHSGTSLLRPATVLIFVDDSPNTWDPTWDNSTDNGQFGGNGDTFWFATNTSVSATYRTPVFTDVLGPHLGQRIYAVVLEWNFNTEFYVSGVLHGADNGTYYAVVPGTYLLNDSPTLPQQFDGGSIQTSNQISIVPEPSSLALFTIGMGALVTRYRRKRQTD